MYFKNRYYENKLISNLISKEKIYTMKIDEIILNKYKKLLAFFNPRPLRLIDVSSAIRSKDVNILKFIMKNDRGLAYWGIYRSIAHRSYEAIDYFLSQLFTWNKTWNTFHNSTCEPYLRVYFKNKD